MYLMILSMFLLENVTGNLVDKVLHIAEVNGFNPLSTIKLNNQDQQVNDISNYVKHKVGSETGNDEAKMLIIASKNDPIKPLLPHLANGKLQQSILFVVGQIENVAAFKKELLDEVRRVDNAFYFYLVLESQGRIYWHHVISIQHMRYPIIKEVTITADYLMKEDYNLQGMTIRSVDMTWAPYLIMDCDKNNMNCKTSGYCSDLMNILKAKLNFTWIPMWEPTNLWGTIADSGPNNVSGTHTGVFGSVRKGADYQMSVSTWQMYEGRTTIFDFVHVLDDTRILVVKAEKPAFDYGLFTRPFLLGPWLIIALFCMTLLIILVILKKNDNNGSLEIGKKSFITVGWFFLLLVNAHYSGTLTMFFTGSISLPFDSIKDVMQAYPEWTLKHIVADESFFPKKW